MSKEGERAGFTEKAERMKQRCFVILRGMNILAVQYAGSQGGAKVGRCVIWHVSESACVFCLYIVRRMRGAMRGPLDPGISVWGERSSVGSKPCLGVYLLGF